MTYYFLKSPFIFTFSEYVTFSLYPYMEDLSFGVEQVSIKLNAKNVFYDSVSSIDVIIRHREMGHPSTSQTFKSNSLVHHSDKM